ncbi:MAG: hypothetical protein ABI682_03380 [Acidobacteriota bacterium]
MKLSSRRAQILIVAILLLAGNLGFYLWYRATVQDRKDAMEARRTALTRDVDAREQEARRLGAQRDRLSSVSSAIEEFYGKRIGPSRDTLAPVVAEIHLLLQRAGILPTEMSYMTQKMAELPLSQMIITFSFRNDYARFKQLLSSIETDRRWVVIREVGLSRDPELPGGVLVHMALATYFATEDAVPEAPPAVAARAISGAARRRP